ncbi:hypothetical protein YC2023_085162 [Brassica napus]|uniref:Uncharacterized protein n=1 Tax=Brassica oleracea TaxID=3712 RepID=A0A3P6EPW1_BRAOL|nr:unnamed protein product [Brassica oleracea]
MISFWMIGGFAMKKRCWKIEGSPNCISTFISDSDAAPPQPTDATVLFGSSNRKDPPTENVPEGKKPRIA